MSNFLTSPSFENGFPSNSKGTPEVGILASGSGSNFEVLARAAAEGPLDAEITTLVCNNPSAGCLERAERLGVSATVIDHRQFDERVQFDAEVRGHLESLDVDWVVMAGWMRIATPTLLDAFRGRILNIHPSLLPAFPGARAVADALEAGVRVTGCTVHIVTEEVDAGPVVAQAAVPVRGDDTVEQLHGRIQEAEHWLFPRALAHAIANRRSSER